jgi:4-hydroxy-tetrahydrodipicolinate synthase
MTTDRARLRGVFSASATPLTADGAIDHVAFASHCQTLFSDGCDGVALLGTTGEANSFSVGERMEMVDRAIAGGIEPARLLPGTGQTSVGDTVTLARHAVEAGVRAVLVLPPFYYKDITDEGLFRFFSEVVEGVASNRLRVVLYHIPQVAGVGISAALIGRLMTAFPGIVAGLKDSSPDLPNMCAIAEAFPDLSVLAGSDRYLLPLLKVGGAGCITASSNLIVAKLRFIFDNWASSTEAGEVATAHANVEAWRELLISNPQVPALKAMLAHRYAAPEWERVRPPMVELTEQQRKTVLAEMARLESLAMPG